jgi:hypothetical protein
LRIQTKAAVRAGRKLIPVIGTKASSVYRAFGHLDRKVVCCGATAANRPYMFSKRSARWVEWYILLKIPFYFNLVGCGNAMFEFFGTIDV